MLKSGIPISTLQVIGIVSLMWPQKYAKSTKIKLLIL